MPAYYSAKDWINPYVVIRTAGLDWVDRIRFTGNSNKFSHLSVIQEPQVLHPPKQKALIWTDGSLKVQNKEYAMSTTFASHLFIGTTSFVVNGPPSSTELELQAILRAAQIYKNTDHLYFFTDSANTINMI